MQLTLATDNRGNAYQVTNHKAKNSTAAAMLMELSLIQHHSHSPVQLTHTYRENNAWADSLTHCNSEGFKPSKQFTPDQSNWHILHKLIPGIPRNSTTGGDTPSHRVKPHPVPCPNGPAGQPVAARDCGTLISGTTPVRVRLS